MAPNRTVYAEVPSTPYNRPQKFETARILFRKMLEDQSTPMLTGKLFAAPASMVTMPPSPPLTSPPLPDDDETELSLFQLDAPICLMAPVVAPTTPPPSLPRVQSIQCPNIIRPKRKSMLSSDDSFDSADEQDNSSCLGSPIRLTPVPFSLDGTTPATPRRAISISRAAPWAPKRKSTRSSSTYSPHFPVLQPFSRRLDYKTPEGVSTLTSQGGDRDALIGRISKLETLVRELQSELAAHKAGIAHYSATRPVPRTTRRAVNAKCTRSRPLPITADSVFD